jgi:hypothetical protein
MATASLLEVAAEQLALRASCALEERALGSCWSLGCTFVALALKLSFSFTLCWVFARTNTCTWVDPLVAAV